MPSSTNIYVSQISQITKTGNPYVLGNFEIKANYKMQNAFPRKDKPSIRAEEVSFKDREIIQF